MIGRPSASHPVPLAATLARHRRLLLLVMLVLLHLTLLDGVHGMGDRMLMVVHIGVFFLWQPFVRTEERLALSHLAMVVALVAVHVLLQGPVLLMAWTMLLAAIIGGKVFEQGSRWSRRYHLAALAYLFVAILVLELPGLLPRSTEISRAFDQMVRYGLPVIFLFMLAMPAERALHDRPEAVDFFYSVFVFLLLAVLVLGCMAAMLLTGMDYLAALLAVLLSMGGALLFLGWVWSLRGGFSGVGLFLSRHLLSLNMPFDNWVESIASCPADASRPGEFLDWAATRLIAESAWLNGIEWHAEVGRGAAGRHEGKAMRFSQSAIDFTVWADNSLTPAMIWHLNLLLKLLNEFYLARLREAKLRQIDYLQAIYETGSRLTHDVKNILQSLDTLCVAAGQGEAVASPAFQGLIRRQLPAISLRLRQTLDKLGSPPAGAGQMADADGWWRELQNAFAGRAITFIREGDLDERNLPVTLFAAAAENLLQNALEKRQLQTGIAISATLTVEAAGLVLTVCDGGAVIDADLAARLGNEPVRSENGLGIGVYQVSRLAAAAGYALALSRNTPGEVCFRLAPAT